MDKIDKKIIAIIKEEGGVTNKLTLFVRSFCREGDMEFMRRLYRLEKERNIAIDTKYIGRSKHFCISLGRNFNKPKDL